MVAKCENYMGNVGWFVNVGIYHKVEYFDLHVGFEHSVVDVACVYADHAEKDDDDLWNIYLAGFVQKFVGLKRNYQEQSGFGSRFVDLEKTLQTVDLAACGNIPHFVVEA